MSEFGRYQKEMKKKREREKVRQDLDASIDALCRKRDDYTQKAKEALKSGDKYSYATYVSLLKNCIFNIKQAQDLRMNLIIANDLLESQSLNRRTLKEIDGIMKDVYKTSSEINIKSSQKIFDKALEKRHFTAVQLQDLLKNNHVSFEASVNDISDITDTEIKELLQDEIAKEGNNTDDLLESLEAAFPESAPKVEQAVPEQKMVYEGRPEPAPTPKAEPKPEVRPEPKVEPKPQPKPEPKAEPVDNDPASLYKATNKNYVLPPMDLLQDYPESSDEKIRNQEELQNVAVEVEKKLADFDIIVKCENIVVGPSVSRLELRLVSKTPLAQIERLEDDLSMTLRRSVRLLLPIKGKDLIGIEVPNPYRDTVGLKNALLKENVPSDKIKFLLGEDIEGKPTNVEFDSLPHMLVAGSTGSGKSVFLHCLINSLLYRYTPDEVRFVLIDFKRVEFFSYTGLPNLVNGKVIDDHEEALKALQSLCEEMERRYQILTDDQSASNVKEYNQKCNPRDRLPTIVCIIDEYADMIGSEFKKEFNKCVTRLAQKARAASIHLIISTQRPSVDVIDGVIKANLPTRVALRVANHIDSSNIINATGAQNLSGQGDMLFAQLGNLDRYQSPFVSKQEIKAITTYLKQHNQ